jgi:hypothetical protein
MASPSLTNSIITAATNLGIFGVGAAVVGWVARKWVQQYFDKELSRYQAELDKEQVRFNELHNERAKVTAELYARFVVFEEDMRKLTDPLTKESDPEKHELFEPAAKSGNAFIDYYMKNKVYFPPDVCDTIESLNKEMNDVYTSFGIRAPYDSSKGKVPDTEVWHESWKRVTENEVPELKSELESHFRELLGVETEG